MTVPFLEDISTVKLDVSFKDPNIRGATGSVMAAATEADHDEFIRNLKAGMSRDDAEQELAEKIARRSQRVVGPTQEQQ